MRELRSNCGTLNSIGQGPTVPSCLSFSIYRRMSRVTTTLQSFLTTSRNIPGYYGTIPSLRAPLVDEPFALFNGRVRLPDLRLQGPEVLLFLRRLHNRSEGPRRDPDGKSFVACGDLRRPESTLRGPEVSLVSAAEHQSPSS